ncbi:MAG TPA: ATP-binding protein [Rhizomicrobium sp.]|nr:ATP-binding protein [Rhizomicrobium sp.]
MKPRFRSLLWRIIGLHVFALTAAAVALPLAIYFLLNDTAASYENRTLRAHADTVALYLAPNPAGGWSLSLPDDLRTFYQHEFDGFAYSVIDQSGRVAFSSLPGGAPILRNDKRLPQPVYFNRQRGKAIYYGASIPERRGAENVWVEVAQDLQHPDVIVDDIVADFLRHVAWFTIPIVIFLIVADIAIVRRALHPVVQASELARSIDTTRLELRLPAHEIPREIRPLVKAVNHALDRIEQGFRTLRNFTADAAHELRTPLSVLRLRVDTTLPADVAAPLRKDIEAMSYVVEGLLAVAELEGTLIASDETADLHAITADAISLLAPIALRQGKDIALTGALAPVIVRGNRGMLFQAVRNLAENALTHTAPGTCVEIALGRDGSISVMDEGPGIPAGEQPLIFDRFWRGESKRGDGAGLGLAIVQRIVDAHGGTVKVCNRMPRGAVFSIQLALASVPFPAAEARLAPKLLGH